MEELTLGVKIALGIFGLGACVALSIVPWVCIGTGLFNQDQEYESYIKKG